MSRQRKALESFINRSQEVKAEDKDKKEANMEHKVKAQSQVEQESEVKQQDNTGANMEAFLESQAQVQKQVNDEEEAKGHPQEEEKAEMDDPALKFIAQAQKGQKKQRMEDIMVKRTHWYKKEDLRKIEQLSRMTGESKYQVISTAINSLYLRVMEMKNKKS